MEETDTEIIEEPISPFVSFISEVCTMGDLTDYVKAEMRILVEVFIVKSTDEDCVVEFASVEKPRTPSDVHSDGMLLRVFLSDSASQQVLPTSLHPALSPFSFFPSGLSPW